MSARELLQKAAERIERLTGERDELVDIAQQFEDSHQLLVDELGLVKTAFKMIEYQLSPGFDTYDEALEKAAEYEQDHGVNTLSVFTKQASEMPAAPTLGKAANSPTQVNFTNMSAEKKMLSSMLGDSE